MPEEHKILTNNLFDLKGYNGPASVAERANAVGAAVQ